MTIEQIVRSNCRLCGYLCGLNVQVKGDRVVAIEPDPSRYPYDKKIVQGCVRCKSNLDFLDHPNRINYPLKRVSDRGSGQWEKITWDQALEEISDRLSKLADHYGPETLATSIGGPHTVYWPLHRFLNLFGSPNNLGIGQICWNPAIWVNSLTFGWPLENELVPNLTQTAIIWGMNPAESDNSLLWRTILEYKRSGGNLIVIDPRESRTAKQADRWLAIKPGSDADLALGFLHVIINDNLYNREFVDEWCYGYEDLKKQIQSFSPQAVSEVTGISPKRIIKTAREYASSYPASIISGRGIDQIGANSLPAHRAIACLRAVTGNVDNPGGSHLAEMPSFIPEIDFELSEKLPKLQREKQLGSAHLNLQTKEGYDTLKRATEKLGGRLPERYLTSAHPNLIWRAMLTGDPYPIRSMIVMGSNPIHAHADSKLITEALKSLDLLVTLELSHSPTSLISDYVLPIAGGLERSVLQSNAGTANIAYGGKRAVKPYYERRTDYDFWRGLGIRMGQVEYWPWESFEESLSASLEPINLTWNQFCESGLYSPEPEYQKYTDIYPGTNEKKGFATYSGKIELWSTILEKLGVEALPIAKPLLERDKIFNLTLITGGRVQPFYASAYRQINSLRKKHPIPIAEIHPNTAKRSELKDGDVIWVESKHGRALFKLKTIEMITDVVSVEYGWWYPEMDKNGGGDNYFLSNANVLTNANFEHCDPVLGQWQFNGLPCRVYTAGECETKFINSLEKVVDFEK